MPKSVAVSNISDFNVEQIEQDEIIENTKFKFEIEQADSDSDMGENMVENL